MNLRVDNKIFLPYCLGLTGLIGGGLIYSVINDKKKKQSSPVQLIQPSNLKNVNFSTFLNIGGVLGGLTGFVLGYISKPVGKLLTDKLG